jgi:tetratricopeptide (TPR) repeat protein
MKRSVRFLTIFCTVFLSCPFLFASPLLPWAKEEIENGNIDEAKNILHQVIASEKNPETKAEAYFLLAEYAETLEEANKNYEKILQLPPNSYTDKAKLAYAKNAYCEKDYKTARKNLIEIMQQTSSPYFAEAVYWTGLTHLAEKNYENSLTYLKNYLIFGRDPVKREIAVLNLANAYFNLGKYEDAINEYQRQLNSNESQNFTPELLYKMGLCYEQTTQYEKAAECYRQVINQYPYSSQRFLAETQLSNLTELGLYSPPLERPQIRRNDNKKYIVQLAAFQEKESAESALKEFQKKGLNPFIYEKFVNNEKYFAVGLGPFATENEAKYLQRKLSEQAISSFIYKKP